MPSHFPDRQTRDLSQSIRAGLSPLRLTDVRPRTPRASTGAGGGGFQKRSDVSFLRVITPRLA